MAFRTLIITTHSKLEYSMNYLVYRIPGETKRILLDEIHTIILESTAISITTSLLVELSKRKINIIICDEKRQPNSQLLPFYGAHNTSKKVLEQINWKEDVKNKVWKSIIQKKIFNQSKLLLSLGKNDKAEQLDMYANFVEDGDITNREGHAAKVYFNNAFYDGFTRNDDSLINACLDYGYTILLSMISRSIVASGYITQIGIHHKGEFNEFNLSCDLIEPLRFLVDYKAKTISNPDTFKDEMASILSMDVLINGRVLSLNNAIPIYVNSVLDSLNSGNIKIAFINQNEL